MSKKHKAQIKKYIERYVTLTEEEHDEFYKALNVLSVKKKEHLILKGEYCTKQYFVLEGLLRMYHIDEKGDDHIELFAIENWWITNMDSFVNETPSNAALQTLENSKLLVLEKHILKSLYIKIPKLERLFRKITEGLYIATQRKQETYMKLSSKERYESLLRSFPDFIQRVPQYMIASYLNMSPEYLSEIRKS